jgi:hypothetical protein
MSESKANLEQILELLLAEENEKAEELLHEYVVAKARSEYEKVLDEADDETEKESEEDAVEETVETEEEDKVEEDFGEEISQDHDFVDDISADAEEIEDEEEGRLGELDDEEEEGDAEEGDIEDKVDDLEAELEDLRAEFEKLLGDDDSEVELDGEDDAEELDLEEPIEIPMDPEFEEESIAYDIEESSEEAIDEATKLSDAVAQPKGGDADSNESSLTKAPKQPAVALAKPVSSKDGGEGKKGDSAKDNTPTDNINVDHKKV